MDVIVLGSGGSMSAHRGQPSLFVSLPYGGRSYVFDAGEASSWTLEGRDRINREKISQKTNLNTVKKIFITHLHGDHVFGLPGMMCRLSALRATTGKLDPRNEEVIDIIGPTGLAKFLRNAFLTTKSVFSFRYRVTELSVRDKHNCENEEDEDDAELHSRELRPRRLYPDTENRTQVWNIEGDILLEGGPLRDFCVKACRIKHAKGLDTFGYVMIEPDLPRRLLAKNVWSLLEPLRLEEGETNTKRFQEKYGVVMQALKDEECVTMPNGLVLDPLCKTQNILGPRRPGRKICVLGDTFDPSEIVPIARSADLVVHEASQFGKGSSRKARQLGHSSASMAGSFARSIIAKQLVLNHIGSKCHPRNKAAVASLRSEAMTAMECEETNRVHVSYDGMVVSVPAPP